MQRRRRKFFFVTLGSLLVCLFAPHLTNTLMAQVSPAVRQDVQAQVEKGRQTVGVVCVACHTNILRMVQVHKMSREQWAETVYSMIGRGAQVMPDEIMPVTAFLAATAGSGGPAVAQTPGEGQRGRTDRQTPEADGRAILQRSCLQCHDLATASTKPASEDWNAVISKMMTYGARLTPADQQKLAEYLNGLAK
jgi:mono/diheme cytochrome c family protein